MLCHTSRSHYMYSVICTRLRLNWTAIHRKNQMVRCIRCIVSTRTHERKKGSHWTKRCCRNKNKITHQSDWIQPTTSQRWARAIGCHQSTTEATASSLDHKAREIRVTGCGILMRFVIGKCEKWLDSMDKNGMSRELGTGLRMTHTSIFLWD